MLQLWIVNLVLLYFVRLIVDNTVSDVCWEWAILLHAVSFILHFRTRRFAYITRVQNTIYNFGN